MAVDLIEHSVTFSDRRSEREMEQEGWRMSEINAGDKVRFTDEYLHIMQPRYYPAPGTVGDVVAKHPRTGEVCVQWPAGSTSRSDMWWCSAGNLELVQKGESNEREQ